MVEEKHIDGKDELQVSNIKAATGKNFHLYKIMHINFISTVVSRKFVSAAVIALGMNKEP